jgi:hypothetical protein
VCITSPLKRPSLRSLNQGCALRGACLAGGNGDGARCVGRIKEYVIALDSWCRWLLREALLRERFADLLLFRLYSRTDDYVGFNDCYPTALRKIVQAANAELWWQNLLREARNTVPHGSRTRSVQ